MGRVSSLDLVSAQVLSSLELAKPGARLLPLQVSLHGSPAGVTPRADRKSLVRRAGDGLSTVKRPCPSQASRETLKLPH